MRTPTLQPNHLPMSPSQVAQATGASRRTVMRAVQAGELRAFRDNRNHWKITAQAFDEWAVAQCAHSEQVPTHAHSEHTFSQPPSISLATAEELAIERETRRLVEVEAAELRGKLAATEAERDRLYEIVQNLNILPVKRRKWWFFR